jgi:hypothetical protein
MSISSHLGMVLLVIVGVVTIIGVAAIAAIETRRMGRGQPPIMSSISKKRSDKAEKES